MQPWSREADRSQFKIADNRPVAVIAPPGPIVNADGVQWFTRRAPNVINGPPEMVLGAHVNSNEALSASFTQT
jgi:hypothetical protein